MHAKSLILFSTRACAELGQAKRKPEESRPWGILTQLAHKVIHKICGQRKNVFSIIDLGAFAQMNPSFLAQVARRHP
jgi:hypothetical protein